MKFNLQYVVAFIVLSILTVIPPSFGSPQGPAGAGGDNTRANKNSAPTADQQKTNSTDQDITKKIRASITDDKTLSMYAHNVKIITQDGKVTLKGPVRSDDEKSNIQAKAVAVAGDGNVDNQIDVTPPKQ